MTFFQSIHLSFYYNNNSFHTQIILVYIIFGLRTHCLFISTELNGWEEMKGHTAERRDFVLGSRCSVSTLMICSQFALQREQRMPVCSGSYYWVMSTPTFSNLTQLFYYAHGFCRLWIWTGYHGKDLHLLQHAGSFSWEVLMDGGDNGWRLESSGGPFISHLAIDVSYWLGP